MPSVRGRLKKLDRIVGLIESGLVSGVNKKNKVVVAGGAIRDAVLGQTPRDIDIFILDGINPNGSLNVNLHDIEIIIGHIGMSKKIIVEPGCSNAEEYQSGFAVVAELKWNEIYDDIPIQIICRKENNAAQLIDSFDWNVCQLAYDTKGNLLYDSKIYDFVQNAGWYGVELQYNKSRSGDEKKALKRGFKFEDRYGLKISDLDLDYLCWAIVDTNTQEKIDIDKLNKELEDNRTAPAVYNWTDWREK